MGRINYNILKRSPSKKRMFDLIVEFIISPVVKTDLQQTILSISEEAIKKDPRKGEIRAYKHPHFPSKSLLYDYLFTKEKQIFGSEIDDILNFLEEKYLIHKDYTHSINLGALKDQEYALNGPYIEFLNSFNLIYPYLLGFDYSVEHYQNSVYKIEIKKDGDTFLGTGWIIDYIKENQILRVLVTNSHVVENADKIRILNYKNEEIEHLQIEDFGSTGVDVAFIELPYDSSVPDFTIEVNCDVLEEIVTIGYPRIPLAKDAFQVAHKGEINSIFDDYYGQELIIISARTAPGNSGSPVINEKGMVVGMVTKELFEKKDFTEKGITPYSACIPSSKINEFFDESRIINEFIEKLNFKK